MTVQTSRRTPRQFRSSMVGMTSSISMILLLIIMASAPIGAFWVPRRTTPSGVRWASTMTTATTTTTTSISTTTSSNSSPPTSNPSLHDVQNLLDQAMALYERQVLLDETVTTTALAEQLLRVILDLVRARYLSVDGNHNYDVNQRLQQAVELDNAMDQGQPLATVQQLALDYHAQYLVTAVPNDDAETTKSSMTCTAYRAIRQQLTAWEQMLPTLVTTTPVTTRPTPVQVTAPHQEPSHHHHPNDENANQNDRDHASFPATTSFPFYAASAVSAVNSIKPTTSSATTATASAPPTKTPASTTATPTSTTTATTSSSSSSSSKVPPPPAAAATMSAWSSTRNAASSNAPADKTQGRSAETTRAVPQETRESSSNNNNNGPIQVDVAIVGAGLGGLCAGAILNTLYGKKVGIFESHYLAGGCAHAFDRKSPSTGLTFTMDSGPTILLGCSDGNGMSKNALQQVLQAINQTIDWIPYDSWGMIESPNTPDEKRWSVPLGPQRLLQGPVQEFGGDQAVREYRQLQKRTQSLTAGTEIPALAMRPGPSESMLPTFLRFFPRTLIKLVTQDANVLTGTFAPYMDGPLFKVTNPWLRNWLDALAFSLSGLPANRTAAAAMAVVLQDMETSQLDYPVGGMGSIVDALVRGVEQGGRGSKVHLKSPVARLDCNEWATRFTGVTLENGQQVLAREGVIYNAPVWTLSKLIQDPRALQTLNANRPPAVNDDSSLDRSTWQVNSAGPPLLRDRASVVAATPRKIDAKSTLDQCAAAEKTGSFMHLHLALRADGLDLTQMEAHYTVMDQSLAGSAAEPGPCGVLNMIAVSNPCKLDPTLAPKGYIVVHAYGAANEPYELWQGLDRNSAEYKALKQERAAPLWRAVESIIPDARQRAVLDLIGSPLTHERFLRRPQGTYGSATEDYLSSGETAFETLVLANDGVFPGIGVPAVAIAGASAANAFVGMGKQWRVLDRFLKDVRK